VSQSLPEGGLVDTPRVPLLAAARQIIARL